MKKIPVELLTTVAPASAYSPLIWDGTGIVVSSVAEHNLQDLARHLRQVSTRSTEQELKIQDHKALLDRVGPRVDYMYREFTGVTTKIGALDQNIVALGTRTAQLESRVATLLASNSSLSLSTAPLFISPITALQADVSSNSDSQPLIPSITEDLVISDSAPLKVKYDEERGQFILSLSAQEVFNRIGLSKGVIQNPDIQSFSLMLSPTAIKGDGDTIKVSYDSNVGEFTVSSSHTASPVDPLPVRIDNRYLRYEQEDLTINKSYGHANISVFNYESANYYGQTTVNQERFSRISDDQIYSFLPRELPSLDAISKSGLNRQLKHGVFNVSDIPTLKGDFYLLKDFNSLPSSAIYTLPAVNIHESAIGKTCRIEIDFALHMEWLNNPLVLYGKEFPVTDRNFIFPFCLYWMHNATHEVSSLIGGEMLRFATVTGDGYGSLATYRTVLIYPSDSLEEHMLADGLIQMKFIVGFKVANISTSLFTDTLYDNYLVEPKLSTIVSYL